MSGNDGLWRRRRYTFNRVLCQNNAMMKSLLGSVSHSLSAPPKVDLGLSLCLMGGAPAPTLAAWRPGPLGLGGAPALARRRARLCGHALLPLASPPACAPNHPPNTGGATGVVRKSAAPDS